MVILLNFDHHYLRISGSSAHLHFNPPKHRLKAELWHLDMILRECESNLIDPSTLSCGYYKICGHSKVGGGYEDERMRECMIHFTC